MKSALKALQVIEMAATESDGITVQHIADVLGFPYATAYRLAATLLANGYLEFKSEGKLYRPGPRLMRLYGDLARQTNLGRRVCPALIRLNEKTQETVHLAVRAQNEVMYLETIVSSRSTYMYTAVGTRAPLHSTALGKALLAFSSDEEINAILSTYEFKSFTAKTITDEGRLRAEIGRIRANGYAIDDEEGGLGRKCMGSIIIDNTHRPVAAISLSAPAARWAEERAVDSYKEALIFACREASQALGGYLSADARTWYDTISKNQELLA